MTMSAEEGLAAAAALGPFSSVDPRPSRDWLSWARMVAVLALAWKVWTEHDDNGITCGAYGNGLMGVMVAHQIMHVFG